MPVIEIPVCYDREFASDIDDVARVAGLPETEVIRGLGRNRRRANGDLSAKFSRRLECDRSHAVAFVRCPARPAHDSANRRSSAFPGNFARRI